MTPGSGITMIHEYDTLRNELLEAKRHIFERPLIIAALTAAGLQFLDKPFALALPSVVALLTLFNFWFTLNRIQSANRIVAYIQLVLEPSAKLQWIGWDPAFENIAGGLEQIQTLGLSSMMNLISLPYRMH